MMPQPTITPNSAKHFLDRLIQVDVNTHDAPSLVFNDLVKSLRTNGIEPGTPVMLAIPNSVQFAVIIFALLEIGAVPVLLPSSAPASRIYRIAQVVGARNLIALHLPPGLAQTHPAQALAQSGQLIRLDIPRERRYQHGEVILLTSGTSGIFSGCLFHIDDLFRNARNHAQAVEQRAEDRILINLPMYYSYAFVAQLLSSFALGNTAIIAGPPFTPGNYERTIETYQITQSSITPTMVNAWLQSGSGTLPAPLRRLTIGGDALPASLVEAVLSRNPGIELYLTYGLTQAGPRVATLAAHRSSPDKYASVGKPFPEVNVYLHKDNPSDKDGELIVETYTGMIRRIRNIDEGIDTPCKGERRIIHTGDRFTIDEDGYLFFKQRNPTYVMSRGEKVCLKSVCEIAETIAGVSRAEAWVHNDAPEAGGVEFTLDVYCHDASLSEGEIRRQLGKTLLRSEQPKLIALHSASEMGWRKTARQNVATK
ncbi:MULTISPECIES: class I adenylate-forming enzyme family protein [Brenneria]|uniref:Long-chain fatty acid--CoA ligase n=1 Tax=Brenneria nigrifluens DSM 30175 = ATCC 13028 TaxID=1121120 RepID=A0A2U1UP36_9GAMM|nr:MULTISPECIES: class I adenylate-forming enzyme family protein [Brenneria]EHD23258.1 AMP-dependent synthetase and ligase [Brenneria sp. EniD312]PWC23448.1 long-chain fatty acid--CoA ligase [Brenneria nigrifluens DSM 30175 = ATCC 13028]QCR06191.1 long-chain fatty acid--CoA ligase [Brenneria nigrifluens DSM 30175 = ATCC 13028]